MNGWLIAGIICFVFLIWSWFSDYRNNTKTKVAENVEKEFKVTKKINEAKNILSKKKFFRGFEDDSSDYFETDKTIGHCPKCKIGYLEVSKIFTGLDGVYNRYPTYQKFLKCFECGYTENYWNLKRRRYNTKLSNKNQFKRDFQEGYKI